MNVYKAFFADDRLAHCQYVCESASSYSASYSERKGGELAFAIIKAETLDEARTIARGIAHEADAKQAA